MDHPSPSARTPIPLPPMQRETLDFFSESGVGVKK
jgi:hypothetical protein